VPQDIKRNFPHIMDIGSGAGYLPKLFDPSITSKVTLVESSRKVNISSFTTSHLHLVRTLHRDADSEFESMHLPPISLFSMTDLPLFSRS
jgi:hypothetical protein